MVLVANGTTTTEKPESARCKKLAQAGAVRIKWPADPDRKEPESFMWCILQDADFAPRKDRHLAWRLSATELQKRAQEAVEQWRLCQRTNAGSRFRAENSILCMYSIFSTVRVLGSRWYSRAQERERNTWACSLWYVRRFWLS